jgi:hypothetical protein
MCPPPERSSFGVSAARALLPPRNIRESEYTEYGIYVNLNIQHFKNNGAQHGRGGGSKARSRKGGERVLFQEGSDFRRGGSFPYVMHTPFGLFLFLKNTQGTH